MVTLVEMSVSEKTGQTVHHIDDSGYDAVAHVPVVAEGTGKTANNAGAKEREVYNVCGC